MLLPESPPGGRFPGNAHYKRGVSFSKKTFDESYVDLLIFKNIES